MLKHTVRLDALSLFDPRLSGLDSESCPKAKAGAGNLITFNSEQAAALIGPFAPPQPKINATGGGGLDISRLSEFRLDLMFVTELQPELT